MPEVTRENKPIDLAYVTLRYCRYRESVQAIADRLDVSEGRIYHLVGKHKLERSTVSAEPGPGEVPVTKIFGYIEPVQLARMLRAGQSMAVIMAHFGKTERQIKESCRRRGWPVPERKSCRTFDYGVKDLEPLNSAPQPPPADSLEATEGRYSKIADWAAQRDIPPRYAMQQWHKIRASAQQRSAAA